MSPGIHDACNGDAACIGFIILMIYMEQNTKKRLIIVSNRLPFQLKIRDNRFVVQESDGGLVSALKSYFDNTSQTRPFDSTLWIGSAEFTPSQWSRYQASNNEKLQYDIEPIFLDKKLYNRFYNGFCNATLWPLFHYFPSFVEFDSETFLCYEEVNRIFSDKILSILQTNDILWIHDYQLMLVPGMVRDRMRHATIGFFLHIPFPAFEVFRLLHRPWKEKIIKGLIGTDLIGFHTYEYVQHFLKTIQMIGGYDHQFRKIQLPDRTIKVEMFSLGIDFDKFNSAGKNETIANLTNTIKQNFLGKKIIFSVDRLDYTKGITHRLSSFERFLDISPEWRDKVVFIQVVIPSRQVVSKYNERKRMIEEEIGRINGKFSSMYWQPVIYRYNQLSFEELTSMYRAADIALIIPLCDGMNLVAKEFVASKSESGVLILSELAGASKEMSEALIVNPVDRNEVAMAIRSALEMPAEIQNENILSLQRRLKKYTVIEWMNDFLNRLNEVKCLQIEEETRILTGTLQKKLLDKYAQASRRLFLLDYDGTLVPYSRAPHLAHPDKVVDLLLNLAKDKKNDIAIISGRDRISLNTWFGHLPFTLIAEHGASIRIKGQAWKNQSDKNSQWKEVIMPILDLYSERSPGAFVEEKENTLVWHYRNVNPELAFTRSRELLDNLYHMVRNSHLQVLDGNKVIEIKPSNINKGIIASQLIKEDQYDFIIAIGDDKTDEDMFRVIPKNGYSIKIGEDSTIAQYFLSDQADTIRLLRSFSDTKKSFPMKQIG